MLIYCVKKCPFLGEMLISEASLYRCISPRQVVTPELSTNSPQTVVIQGQSVLLLVLLATCPETDRVLFHCRRSTNHIHLAQFYSTSTFRRIEKHFPRDQAENGISNIGFAQNESIFLWRGRWTTATMNDLNTFLWWKSTRKLNFSMSNTSKVNELSFEEQQVKMSNC